MKILEWNLVEGTVVCQERQTGRVWRWRVRDIDLGHVAGEHLSKDEWGALQHERGYREGFEARGKIEERSPRCVACGRGLQDA